MQDKPTFVIVGANLAGGRAAEALRKNGFDGRIILIGGEPDAPYERPPLSKEYLRAEQEKSKLFILSADFYRTNQIELRLGYWAEGLDVKEKSIRLDDGEEVHYDKLLLTTGAKVRRLDVPGSDLEGIYYLRTIADAEAIGAELQPGRRCVVIGAGFIGAEVAASARESGLEVTIIEILPVPMSRVLGDEMGTIYGDIHRDHGVDLRLNEGVERFEGNKRVERVVGSSGAIFDCDFVVVGVGVIPETALVEGTDIEVNNGIVVNEYCETSVPDVYAAGDVANFPNPILGQRVRLEHWQNAQNQGIAAAKNMMGIKEVFSEVPWFWSDQYDLNMQLIGHPHHWDKLVFRGSVPDRQFTAFFVKDGKMQAALAVNRPMDIRPCREIIQAGQPVDVEKLQDEAVQMRSLMPPRA